MLDVEDHHEEDILQHFGRCVAFIDEGRQAGAVLVYCTAGVSRSASVVIAYIMTKLNCGLDEGLRIARASRQWVNPNPGFIDQLRVRVCAGVRFAALLLRIRIHGTVGV